MKLKAAVEWFRNYSLPENWVKAKGAFALILVVSTLFFGVTQYVGHPLAVKIWVWAIAFAVQTVIWWVGRACYWRTGRGRKVGICYDGFRVPIDDWLEIRREMARLCKSGRLREATAVRIVPTHWLTNELEVTEKAKRLGFSFILKITHSVHQNPKEEPVWTIQWSGHLKRAVGLGVVKATAIHIHEMASQPQHGTGLKDILRSRAASWLDAILLPLGVTAMSEDDYETASALLFTLDQRLEGRFRRTHSSRAFIRRLDAHSLAAGSRFPGDKPPSPDELVEIVRKTQEAIDLYGDELPGLYLQQSRNVYYTRDLERAVQLSEEGLRRPLNALDRTCAILHLAVLYLFQACWEKSASRFKEFLSDDQLYHFDWKDLIRFADFAEEFGFEHAIFLRAFYRKIYGNETIPSEIATRAEQWMDCDQTRFRLRNIYRGTLPRAHTPVGQPKTPRAKAASLSDKKKQHRKTR